MTAATSLANSIRGPCRWHWQASTGKARRGRGLSTGSRPSSTHPSLPFGECMSKAGPTAAQGLGRRQILIGIGVGALALGAPGGTVVADAVAAEGESTLTRFLDVSRLLTRRRALDAVL